jgi:hypothetical protein
MRGSQKQKSGDEGGCCDGGKDGGGPHTRSASPGSGLLKERVHALQAEEPLLAVVAAPHVTKQFDIALDQKIR